MILILLAFLVSIFGTIVGAGGGFLLVPALMLLHPDWSPAQVSFLGLFTAMCNAVSATSGYARLGRVDWRSGVAFGLAMVVPAVIGRLVIVRVNAPVFSLCFGVLLILVAGWLFYKVFKNTPIAAGACAPRPGMTVRKFTDVDGVTHEYAFNMPFGLSMVTGVGFISSFFGIGGGIVMVPIMTQVLSFPVLVATATSMLALLITTATGVGTHLIAGGGPLLILPALCVGAGAIAGGQVGARMARKIKAKFVLALLAAGLIAIGILLIRRFALGK